VGFSGDDGARAMKVLFLSQIVPYPPHGGVLQRGYNLLRELGRHASVHLLAFVHPDELPTEAAREESRRVLQGFCERVEYFPLWAKASRVHSLSALAAGVCSASPFSTIAHRSAAFQRRASESLATIPFDVVHVDTVALSQFIARHRKVPSVLTHHNIESMLLERRSQVETRSLVRWVLQRESEKLARYEAMAAPRFDVNIMMSAHDESTLTRRVPGLRTAVVPNGVDTEYFTPAREQETPALVYTGGMNMFANRDAAMYFLGEIWPLITTQAPDVRFFAVGQDPPKELRDFAARDPRVVVTGKVPDIRPYVWQSAVYVVPLRVGGGTRLKVLDAMAMGKALVSTSIGCEGIDVKPGEHLVVADTPVGFAQAAVALLGDRARRLELGRAARALVERHYAWPVIGELLLGAYEQAIARERPRRSVSRLVANG
jgi:sugar transferase (PEP-CTERM/EpsH1 system associated)